MRWGVQSRRRHCRRRRRRRQRLEEIAELSSVRLMYSYDPRMRKLAALLLLQSIPMYM